MLLLRSRCACVIASCGLICNRCSALLVVLHPRRQTEPRIHRLLPDRIAGRRKGRGVKRTHSYSADGRVAISFPIECGAAIRAEMKPNAITTVGVALVNLPFTVEPHPIFRITRAEMESCASPTLARLAVAQINPIGFTRGDYSQGRSGIARSVPPPPPTWFGRILADPVGCRRAA
jgi:hypothetical protein